MDDRFLVVEASDKGPVIWKFSTLEGMASWLLACGRHAVSFKGATAWKKVRGKWGPMFPWQHGGGAA